MVRVTCRREHVTHHTASYYFLLLFQIKQAFEETREAALHQDIKILRYQNIGILNEGSLYDVKYPFFVLKCIRFGPFVPC